MGGALLHLILTSYWLLALTVCLIGALPPPPLLAPVHAFVTGLSRRGKLLSAEASSKVPTVPQSWFTHFYVTAIISTSSLLCVAAGRIDATSSGTLSDGRRIREVTNVVLLLLMEAQALRRFYESCCVSRYSPAARMHAVTYLVGISYYVATPLSLISHQDGDFDFFSARPPPLLPPTTVFFTLWRSAKWWHWLGAAVFAWGSVHQHRCHAILAALRSSSNKGVDSRSGYGVPRGDWFQLVSCAHYLAEIVIYAGLVIASGGQEITVWLVLCWVVANLSIAAVETHVWYVAKFPDYPRTRRAIIPLLL